MALELFFVALIALLAAAALVQIQSEMTNHKSNSQNILPDYLSGENLAVVFQARWLMRVLINATMRLNPFVPTPVQANNFLQCLFAALGFLMIYVASRRFVPPGWAIAAMLMTAMVLPWGFLSLGYKISYPYDLPSMAFIAAGMAAIVWRRLNALVWIVLIGTFNKETTLWLLPAAAAIWGLSKGWRIGAAIGALLVGVYLFAYLASRSIASDIPYIIRTGVDDKLAGELRIINNWRELTFQGTGRWELNVWWALAIYLPGFAFWRRLPAEARWLQGMSLIHLAGILIMGNLREVRILNELLPAGALSAACLMHGYFSRRDANQTPGESPPETAAPSASP